MEQRARYVHKPPREGQIKLRALMLLPGQCQPGVLARFHTCQDDWCS